jgi:hypothetical protein
MIVTSGAAFGENGTGKQTIEKKTTTQIEQKTIGTHICIQNGNHVGIQNAVHLRKEWVAYRQH